MTREDAYRAFPELRLSLRVGLLAGLVGGALVGLLEAGWLMLLKWGTISPGIFLYGAILYALVGGAMGLGIGLLLFAAGFLRGKARRAAGAYALLLALVFALNGLVVFRFRTFRDVMHEQPIPLLGNLLLVLVFGVLFALLYLGLRALLTRTSLGPLVRVPGTAILLGGLLFILLMIKLATGLLVAYKPRGLPLPPTAEAESRPLVLLIMVDALRADRLSCYGYTGNRTPNIDLLAGEGILFEKPIAQASWTRPATASLLTSLYPASHKTTLKPDILPDEVLTLAEVLRKEGYFTAGLANNINVAETFNFQQGYDSYLYLAPDYFFLADESSAQLAYYSVLRLIRERFLVRSKQVRHYYQDADVVNRHLFTYLETKGRERPTFLFAHFMEPHDPYFAHPYNGVAVARVDTPDPAPSRAGELSALYDGEISFLDERLGMLFDRLRQLRLYDRTLIVLTADHGEEFYDHRGWWHGTTLYQEAIHVPLILRLPGGRLGGTRFSEPVRQIDIAPTILAAVGAEIPAEFQGTNLLPAVEARAAARVDEPSVPAVEGGEAAGGATAVSAAAPAGPVFSEEDHEGNVLQSLLAGGWKLIRANEGNPRGLPPLQLFHLPEDPGESRDLSASERQKVEELGRLLEEALAGALESGVQRRQGEEMDEATRQRLRALGYLQ